MPKAPSLPTFSGVAGINQINSAFAGVASAFENTLSLDGSAPNALQADLDLNSNDIVNAKDINFTGTLYSNGLPAIIATRLSKGVRLVTDSLDNTYTVADLAASVIITGPLTRNAICVLSTANASFGDTIEFNNENTANFSWTLKDSSGNTIFTFTKPGEFIQLRFDGSVFDVANRGLSFTSSISGIVPPSAGGTTNFLRADGSWAAPAGGGGGVTDGDKGDVIVSGGGSVWSLDYTSVNASIAPTWNNVSSKPDPITRLASGITEGTESAPSTNTTVSLSDHCRTYVPTASITLTLPTAPFAGFQITVNANFSLTVTLALGGTDVIDRDSFVHPGEVVKLMYNGTGTWRRRASRGFGFAQNGPAGLLNDLRATTFPYGQYRVTTGLTTNITDRPSCLTGATNNVHIERLTTTQFVQRIWDAALPEQGMWLRTVDAAGPTFGLWVPAGVEARLPTSSLPTSGIEVNSQVYNTTLGSSVRWNGSTWIPVGRYKPLSMAVVSGDGIPTTTFGNSAAPSAAATALNTIDLYQWVCPVDITISSVTIRVSTVSAGGLCKVVFYSCNANNEPGTLMFETADADTSVTGIKTLTASATLTAGTTYWVGLRANNTTNTIFSNLVSSVPTIMPVVPGNNAARAILRRTLTYSTAAPTTWVYNSSEVSTAVNPWMIYVVKA